MIIDGHENDSKEHDAEMKTGTNVPSNASSAASSRKGSKKKIFSRLKMRVKRTASDPVETKNRNQLAVKPLNQGNLTVPLPQKQPLSRTASAPFGGKSRSPKTNTRKLELSRKSSTSSTMSRMSDEDSNESSQFASFVKRNLHDSGVISSVEDEEVVNDAIGMVLSELSDGSANSSMHSSMIQIVDGSMDKEDMEKRNPERFQKLRALASCNDDDVSLDDVNLADESVMENLQRADSSHLKVFVEGDFNEESNQSGNSFLSMRDEDTKDSTDTFYSIQEGSDEDKVSDLDEVSEDENGPKKITKSDSKSSDSFSFEAAFKNLRAKND